MKKLLYINDFETFGGAENVLKTLVKNMADAYTVRCVYAEKDSGRRRTPFSYIFSFRNMIRIAKQLEEFRPDVVHVKNYCYLYSPSILRALIEYKRRNPGVLIVHTAHDMHLLSPNSGQSVYTFFLRKLIRIPLKRPDTLKLFASLWDHRGVVYSVLKLAQWTLSYPILKSDRVFDVIISPSVFLSDALRLQYPEKTVVTIRNPVNLKLLTAAERKHEPHSGCLSLLFVGRFSKEKGIQNFISSVSTENWRRISLTLVGEGPALEELKKLTGSLHLSDRIRIEGYVNHNDLPAILQTHDCLVLPSILYENAPLTIIEAALSGLWVMTSGHGGMKELAETIGGAYLFDPDDSCSINAAVQNLLQDMQDNKTLERDYDLLENLFSVKRFLEEHRTVYEKKYAHSGETARI